MPRRLGAHYPPRSFPSPLSHPLPPLPPPPEDPRRATLFHQSGHVTYVHLLSMYCADHAPVVAFTTALRGTHGKGPCVLLSLCREYADFRVSSEGELQGVGLLIANEPVNKHLLVLSAIKGGPADRAGITSGG